MIAFLYLIPFITIVVVGVFKKSLGLELNVVDVAMELHVSSIAMMAPLPLLRPDLVDALVSLTVTSAITLIITSALYIKYTYNRRKFQCGQRALAIGAFFYFLSFVVALCIN